MFVNVWDWYDAFYVNALRNGDRQRMQLVELYRQAWALKEVDPEQTITLHDKGIALALALDEPCWSLFHGYRRAEALVFFMNELERGMDAATRLLLEANRPHNKTCPVISWTYYVYICVHLYMDPLGYADEIREALAYMQNDPMLDRTAYRMIPSMEAELARSQGDLDRVYAFTQRFIERNEHVAYQLALGHLMLCELRYHEGDIIGALELAEQSERHARQRQRRSTFANAIAWQALLLQRLDDPTRAASRAQAAVTAMGSIPPQPEKVFYFDALAAYFELCGEPERALSLRDAELAEVTASGSPFADTECRLKRTAFLLRIGGNWQAEGEAARLASERLRSPARFLERLVHVEAGGEIYP